MAGRVLHRSRAGDRFALADESGSAEVALEAELARGTEPVAGDLVRVQGMVAGARLVATRVEILHAYQGEGPFPSPGGEHFRLHQGSPSRGERLRLRARCLAATRAFFAARGYLEVQTPLRVPSPGMEPHLRAVEAGGAYLITSPEYHMKRLLAGGLERIYSLGPVWRADEIGTHHLTEFCMLEWYRTHGTTADLMEEVEVLISRVAQEVRGTTRLGAVGQEGQELDLTPPYRRIAVERALREHAGVELRGVLAADDLGRRARAAGIEVQEGERFEEIFSRILVERVEPALARSGVPVFLHDYPAPLAALARLKPDDPSLADRFELYAGGLELANAFSELTDAEEQLGRLLAEQETRRELGGPVYAVDQRFVRALREGIPPAVGIALGVDRLIMLLAGARDIREVVAFAPEEV